MKTTNKILLGATLFLFFGLALKAQNATDNFKSFCRRYSLPSDMDRPLNYKTDWSHDKLVLLDPVNDTVGVCHKDNVYYFFDISTGYYLGTAFSDKKIYFGGMYGREGWWRVASYIDMDSVHIILDSLGVWPMSQIENLYNKVAVAGKASGNKK